MLFLIVIYHIAGIFRNVKLLKLTIHKHFRNKFSETVQNIRFFKKAGDKCVETVEAVFYRTKLLYYVIQFYYKRPSHI